MTTPEGLPFEYPFRWRNETLAERSGVDLEAAALLEQRDRDLEDYLAATVVPLIFHWHGQVDVHLDKRNGPGEFGRNGTLARIRYRWDTPTATSATVAWYLDGALAFTHTVTSSNPHIEYPAVDYEQEAIVAIVSAVDATAAGLTAFVYLG